jgi:hypothetical protein
VASSVVDVSARCSSEASALPWLALVLAWGRSAMDEAAKESAFAEHAHEQQRAWLRSSYRQMLDWL